MTYSNLQKPWNSERLYKDKIKIKIRTIFEVWLKTKWLH